MNQTTDATSDEFSASAVTSASSSEESEFTTVSHKRQRTNSLPSSVHGEDYTKDYCTFRIIPTECSSEMEVLALLFCEHPKLECARRQIQNRSVLLVAKTKVASDILAGTTSLNGKAVKFEKMGDKSNLRTGVLHHVPLFITEEAILYTEKIVSASRMLRWDQTSQQKVATEMVKFQYEGALPARIKLGLCGNFKVRPFVPTPTRCYKCQKFGHVATTCLARAARCRLCAGTHLTEQCQSKRTSGEAITLKCANCGEAHPASSGLCQKLRDVSETMRTRAVSKFRPAGPPTTNAWAHRNKATTAPQNKVSRVITPSGMNNSRDPLLGKALSTTTKGQPNKSTPYVPVGLPKRVSSLPPRNHEASATQQKSYADSAKPNARNPPPSHNPQDMDTQEKVQQQAVVKAVAQGAANSSMTQEPNPAPLSQVEDQITELIITAISMAKRDLDLIQNMMIKNLSAKNDKIKDYLVKQNQKIMANLTELAELM